MNQCKLDYLKMIQDIITRMSNISISIKGFFISIVTAISAIVIAQKSISNLIFLLFLIPMLVLPIMDTYYLSLERKYRLFYKEKDEQDKVENFSLELPKEKYKNEKRCKFINCLTSKCILLFYLPIILMYIVFVNLFVL